MAMTLVYILAGIGSFIMVGGLWYAIFLYREEKKQHKNSGSNVRGPLL